MKYLLLLLLLWSTNNAYAQSQNMDSLLNLLSNAKEDTLKVNLLAKLGNHYEYHSNPDSALLTYYQALELAKSIGYEKGEMEVQSLLGFYSWRLGDFSTAVKLGYELLDFARSKNDTAQLVSAYAILFNSYRDQGDYEEALRLSFEYLPFSIKQKGVATASIGSIYFGMGKYDSALFYLQKSLTYPKDFSYGWILLMTGRTWVRLNNEEFALDHFHQSIHHLTIEKNYKDLAGAYTSIATLYSTLGQSDSAVYYGKLALNVAEKKSFSRELMDAFLSLSGIYENINGDDAFTYYKRAMELKNEIYTQEKQRQIASYKFNEVLRQNEIQASQADFQNRLRLNAMLGSSFTLLVVAIVLFRNSRLKQKAKVKIEAAFKQLQATQSQLIQSEKMASLGELTAGIAHEIQNPLNFVNNFSEVSNELIDEMVEEVKKGNFDDAKSIANDLKQNLEKINHHGKRADGIVKSMLQHSRTSSGQKEPTDINALCDEYLRLSYHGLRAKDKTFNAKFETDFDTTLDRINVIPQDIGRVILNLINNAFYAVTEKRKANVNGYEPKVLISTKKLGDKVEIKVRDNGSGIPKKVLDKIFQPFFTTKPTGQGTGLGLSLSYDIVKAHGGELKVGSNEGFGAEFIVLLPTM
jgi:two-component system NtrC family sensor kinase